MKLNVFFGNEKAGSLESTENRGVIFATDKNYLQNKNAVPLSASLPLQTELFFQKYLMILKANAAKHLKALNLMKKCLKMSLIQSFRLWKL